MKIGDKVTFIPSCERDDPYTHSPALRHENEKAVTGVIVGVNRAHHWYRVEYRHGDAVLHECFSYIPRQRRAHKPEAREIIAHYQKRAAE